MKILVSVSKLDIYFFLIAIFAVIGLNPYYIWGTLQLFYTISLALLILSSFYFKVIFSNRKFSLSPIIFILVFYFSFSNGASVLGATGISAGIAFIFSIKNNYLVSIFYRFKQIYAFILIPGLILWVLHQFLGNDFLYLGKFDESAIPNQLKVDAGQGYALYPFTVVLDYMLYQPIYRFMGPFDEPGVVGTISAIVLAANKFKLKNKSDFIVLFSGVASLSLAFYLMSFIYLLFKSISNFKYFFSLFLIVPSIIGLASINESFRRYTFERLIIQDDGKISGNNRGDLALDIAYSKWTNGDIYDFLFGISDYVSSGASSGKVIFIKTGFFGFLVFLSVFLISFLVSYDKSNKNLDFYIFLLVFFASIYQRPEVLTPVFIMLFLSGIVNSKNI